VRSWGHGCPLRASGPVAIVDGVEEDSQANQPDQGADDHAHDLVSVGGAGHG
jgi:hypothetical protein